MMLHERLISHRPVEPNLLLGIRTLLNCAYGPAGSRMDGYIDIEPLEGISYVYSSTYLAQ
jgi:hypothetical protein